MRKLGFVVVFLVAAACGGGGGDKVDAIAKTTTTSPPQTAPPLPVLKFAKAEDAATHLRVQWQAGDREAAAQAASKEAVDEMFKHPAQARMSFNGCDSPVDPATPVACGYHYGNGLLRMHVKATNGDWRVESVEFVGT